MDIWRCLQLQRRQKGCIGKSLKEIPCAKKQPVQFAGGEFIRIGTNKKNLKEHPDVYNLIQAIKMFLKSGDDLVNGLE